MEKKQASRRTVLKAAAGLGGGIIAGHSVLAREGRGQTGLEALPTVPLGPHRITRLILGSNPFNGFCYAIPSLAEHMKEWCTPERIAEIVRNSLDNGINTWQFSYYPSSLEGLKIHRSCEGEKQIQWILLGGGEMQNNPDIAASVAALKPLGIAHHGGVTDRAYKSGTLDKVRESLKVVRDTGALVGLSTHHPEVVEKVEEEGWDLDFYMTCFYQLSRTEEETRKMLGELPLGYTFLEGDPERMCRVIQQTRKTCLAFKVLAAGRLAGSEKKLEEALRFAYDNIKPQDAVIVGMYPRFNDEIRENAGVVRRLLVEAPS